MSYIYIYYIYYIIYISFSTLSPCFRVSKIWVAFPGCRAAWHFGCSGGNFFGRSGAPAATVPPRLLNWGVHILVDNICISTNHINIGNGGLVLGITVNHNVSKAIIKHPYGLMVYKFLPPIYGNIWDGLLLLYQPYSYHSWRVPDINANPNGDQTNQDSWVPTT